MFCQGFDARFGKGGERYRSPPLPNLRWVRVKHDGTANRSPLLPNLRWVRVKHDGTDGTANTDGTAIERADGTANTGVN